MTISFGDTFFFVAWSLR